MTQVIHPETYEGQFGTFTITSDDRRSVVIYRAGLMVAALCFAIGVGLVLSQPEPALLPWLTLLYTGFCLALGVSLLMIHIYMAALHRALQAFWVIGSLSAFTIGHFYPEPFALTVYNQPLSILGIGFTFAALTGIFFKEAVCFNRFETKLLTPTVPLLLLGHMVGLLPLALEQGLLVLWAALFLVFAVRKALQPLPPDIGDKSVFAYLKQQRLTKADAS